MLVSGEGRSSAGSRVRALTCPLLAMVALTACQALVPDLVQIRRQAKAVLNETDLARAAELTSALLARLEARAETRQAAPRLLLGVSQLQFLSGVLFEEASEDVGSASPERAAVLRARGLEAFEQGWNAAAAALALRNPSAMSGGGGEPPIQGIREVALNRSDVPAATWWVANRVSWQWLASSNGDGTHAVDGTAGLEQYAALLDALVSLDGGYSQGLPKVLMAIANAGSDAESCVADFPIGSPGVQSQPLALVLRARVCAVALGDRELFRSDLSTVVEMRVVDSGDAPVLAEIARRQAVRFLGQEAFLFDRSDPGIDG